MKILFFDIEVTAQKKIAKIWAINQQGKTVYSGNNVDDFFDKVKDYDVLAWHNILYHDLEYLSTVHNISTSFLEKPVIDTLWLSSLIFIRKPYHRLIKDYKTEPENPEIEDEWDSFFMRHQPWWEQDDIIENDPVRDSKLSLAVFNNCVEEFQKISPNIQQVLYWLLWKTRQFWTFFSYLQEQKLFTQKSVNLFNEIEKVLSPIIKSDFFNNELPNLLDENPVEFAYIFRLVEQNLNRDLSINPDCSILPRWLAYSLPEIDKVFSKIYRHKNYDLKKELRSWWLKDFRVYDNEHWPKISQEEIVEEWFNWWDFIAVLATWGWKSLCFQLPALARAEASWFLTLVISPLQSLMEDQVSNLKMKYHKINVGALHSWMDPLERKEVNERVSEWGIDLLYLSPEMLRSAWTQRLLAKRHIDRLVIDEAHCFSKWWHDFRIDYMFIADFIKELWKVNPSIKDISISCFTATAKQEVIKEIKDYFKNNFDKDLKEFKSTAKRPNLNYEAYDVNPGPDSWKSVDDAKFDKLIDILENEVWTQPCIIFTRYTWKSRKRWAKNLTKEIEERLKYDWYWEIKVAYFHWQLEWEEKSEMMYKFMNWEVNVIVATNAFWMWVDKADVRFVIHYNMPSSLENYLQEAGRAWRDQQNSRCIILYSSDDLDENLQLNNVSKVKKEELQKLLKYIKKEFQSKNKNTIVKSIRDLIKNSWWIWWEFEEWYLNDKVTWDTKLKTALSFLEKPFPNENDPWFITRWVNKTRRIATSAEGKKTTLDGVFSVINWLKNLEELERAKIKDIYREIRNSRLLSIEDLPGKVWWSFRSFIKKDENGNEILYKWVQELVDILRDENLIDLDDEIELYLNVGKHSDSLVSLNWVRSFITTFFDVISEQNGDFISEWSEIIWDKKQLNTEITKRLWNITNSDDLWNFILFLEDRHKIHISWDHIVFRSSLSDIKEELYNRMDLWQTMIDILLDENTTSSQRNLTNIPVKIKLKELAYKLSKASNEKLAVRQAEDIAKFLTFFGIIKVDSWLFLFHTKFTISRWNHLKEISETWKERYTTLWDKHYKALDDFYINKTQQAHIMDEFAQYIIKWIPIDRFIDDYFNLDYESEFLPKYFTKERIKEISRSTSRAKHNEIWSISNDPWQKQILESDKNLLVIAWPWSWKTKSLVHKVASLVLEDWISKDEFLLLTFMRSAKFELKNRIIDLVWSQWYLLEIHTFHSYAYKLLDKDPLKDEYSDDSSEGDQIIKDAIKFLKEHEDKQLPFRVIMIDEFQDIWKTYFDFVEAISQRSTVDENKIRIIATWDDDQSIMEFKWWDIKYIQDFQNQHNAESIVLSRNYRSTQELVDYTTNFAETIKRRLKKWTKLVSWRDLNLTNWVDTHIEAWNCSWNYLFGVKDALDTINSFDSKWRTAVICAENETVLQINHLLQKKWIKAQILLSSNWFRLRDALEFRRFLEICKDENNKVTKENIREKYNTVLSEYWENKNTELLKKIVENIDNMNGYIKPEIVEDFIMEIRDEADVIDDNHRFFVSTFHKAKWREFDNVIICFDPNKKKWWNHDFLDEIKRDNEKRRIYVWMTRAKNNLILMWNKENNKYFEYLYKNTKVKSEKSYANDEADQISVITSLKDVFISYNDDKIIKEPRIWADIQWKEIKLQDGTPALNFLWEWKVIQKSSSKFVESELNPWYKKGYYLASIKVYQKLLHKPRDDDKEHMIFILDLSLKKVPKEYRDINEAKDKIKLLESQIQALIDKWINTVEYNEKYQNMVNEKDALIQTLQEKTQQLEDKLIEAKEDIKKREEEINNNWSRINELQEKLLEIEKEKVTESLKVEELEKSLTKAQLEWNKKVEEKLYKELDEAKNSLKEIEDKLSTIEWEKNELEVKTWELEEENQILKIENEELRKKISDSKWIDFMWEKDEADAYIISLIQSAKTRIIIVDNFVDYKTFSRLSKRWVWVKATVYCSNITLLQWQRINDVLEDQEGNPIVKYYLSDVHDRFLIIDNEVYNPWSSLNSSFWWKRTNISKIPDRTPEEQLKSMWIKYNSER